MTDFPTTEIYDGLDNDCVGQIDENIAPEPTDCGIGECASTGEPGIYNDTFDIKIWAPGVDPDGDATERAGGILQGGNIVVHTK